MTRRISLPIRTAAASACLVILATLPATGPPPALSQDRGAAEVPPFSEVTGHRFGERVTRHHEMVRYLETLAQSTDRVALLDQGESWEGKRLLAAVVTSPENHARLEEIRETNARLADPRGLPPARAEELMEGHPVVLWYGGSIHGNELSGTEGLLKLLERLASADDAATRKVLESAVLIIDPMLNPDGRDAFARVNGENRGRLNSPDPRDWNNDYSPWQGFKYRTGHYYFDTNRDWFAQTQRETRARAETIRRWSPQVSVDAHEMGRTAEFYFDPAAGPYPSVFPDYARRGFERFNDAYAAAFDSAGFEYMTRERYNYFYPGYTTSYSSYQNSVGMLYEQGTSAGLALERPDGSVRTLAEAMEHQYTAAWTAARTAVAQRADVLREWHSAIRAGVREGSQGVRRYLIEPGGDPAHAAEAVRLLRRNGLEVGVLQEDVTLQGVRNRVGTAIGSRSFPAGTRVVEAAQPRSQLVRVLLEPTVPVPDSFLAGARGRVEQDLSARFYDITAWSIPLLYDLPAFSAADGRELPVRAPGEEEAVPDPAVPSADASYAYLLDGASAAAAAALWHLADRGHRVFMLTADTRIAGRDHPSGTGVALVGQNSASLHDDVRALARRFDVDVRAVGTGLAEGTRPSLGTGDAVPLRTGAPSVALLAGMPVHAYSFGWTWYALDRQYEIPHTVLRVESLSGSALSEYDVLVIPHLFSSAGLADRLGEEDVARLRTWVREGGTLVVLGGAVDFARDQLGLLSLRDWYEVQEEESGEEPQRFTVPGAFFQGTVEDTWWLASGSEAELPVLVNSDRIYLPPEGPPESSRRVVVHLTEGAKTPLSGHAWEESQERLPGAVFVYEERAGAGRVVAFAEDPSFRGYWRGPDRLLLNAVVFGPSAP